jgi:outer membrane protein assembly factor BamB
LASLVHGFNGMGHDRAAAEDRQLFGAHPFGKRAMTCLSRVAGLFPLLLLGWTASATAAVTYRSSASVAPAASFTSQTVTVSLTAGDTAVVVISGYSTGTLAVSTITDTASNAYSQQKTITNGAAAVFIWSTAAGAVKTTASVTVTVTVSTATVGFIGVTDYAGVAALGATATNTGATANPTISLTTQEGNNWVVAGFSAVPTSSLAMTAGTGTLRLAGVGACCGVFLSGALVDNTASTPSSVTDSVTLGAFTWAAAALELRSVVCGAVTDPTYVAANAQNNAETVYWSSPTNPSVLVLRKTSAFSGEVPANGTTYNTGNAIGAATVVYKNSGSSVADNQGNGTYYYKVFAQAAGPCYSPGTVNPTSGVSATPSASPPAWSYAIAGGSMLNAGIAGNGTIYTSSNANWMISLNTATGAQNWTPAPTTAAVQGWLTWVPLNWADSTYSYREKITVTAGATAVPSGYAVPVAFNHASLVTAGKALANGNDVRVFYWNGSTWVQLDRVLDNDPANAWNTGTTTTIWVKTQAAIAANGSDGNYYLYYGNPSAVNPPANKANVFFFSDDFEAGNLNKWTISSGSWQAATDQKHGGGTYSLKYPSGEVGANKYILPNPALNQANIYWEAWWLFSYVNGAQDSPDNGQIVRAAPGVDYEVNLEGNGTQEAWDIAEIDPDPNWYKVNAQSSPVSPPTNTWTRIGIGIYGNPGMMRVFKDGVQVNPASGAWNVTSCSPTACPSPALTSGNVGFRKYFTGGAGGPLQPSTGAWWLDDVVARPYVDPEPTTALGAEQGSTGGSVIGGDQGANVYALDATSGAQNWKVTLAGANAVQAAAAVQMWAWSNAAFQSAYSGDVVFVATRNGSPTTNTVYALKATDGTVLWNFNTSATNAPCPCNIDYIVGEPLVDYGRNRIYVASRAGATGTQNSLWVINSLNGAIVQQLALTHIQTSPTLSYDRNTIYVANANNAGTAWTLYAIDATTFATRWTYALTGALKGFVWEDPSIRGRLYLSTADGNAWGLVDSGGSATLSWKTAVAGASNGIPLDAYYVASSDGTIHMLNFTTGALQKTFPSSGTLDGANTLGDLSTETGNELFVGTSGGKLFKIPLPLP